MTSEVPALIIQADAKHLPLPDNSVDLVITSPPYYALRSYTDAGEHYADQIGAESTPAEYLDSLIEVTAECMRVLKPTGSIFFNMGDKYAGGGGQWAKDQRPDPHRRRAVTGKVSTGGKTYGFRRKSLMLLPERYRIRCIDELGLICRATLVWDKPNGLPESVTDRVRRSHEDWMHFTLQPNYFSAIDEIRRKHRSSPRAGKNALAGQKSLRPVGPNSGVYNVLGALPGSVWNIPSEPLIVPDHLGVDHHAAFPTEWPWRIIQAWSPSGICTACGQGRRPVSVATAELRPRTFGFEQERERGWNPGDPAKRALGVPAVERQRVITGYACACPDDSAPTKPAVVLDPLGGSGTVALVASVLGRQGISIDRSHDYSRLARWRTTDPKQRNKAAREKVK